MTRRSDSPADRHASTAAAIGALLYPHAEVVLHDLASGTVAGIWNAWSGRKIGSPSLLDDDTSAFDRGEAVLGPYEKTGEDGRRIKSVTAVLPGPRGRAAGLLCINLDVSRLDEAMRVLAAFVAPRTERPATLFAQDWRERINLALHAWLRERGIALAALTRADRVALVAALDAQGVFATRHAAQHLAGLIGASRASIYNYLADARRPTTSAP
ncbi:helix-turn-helix transcriptional regulator [Tahibacter soli]|uniref:PAS domain-containing protein n=1 Tax=Tahibacter soli TaxID=2983605 RepID=A0A9X3YPY2_9GAMM|nr:PAS domain-containing protein [Tahibacter soli]MDC8014581.1 PAS domain-containing protein [Tahibacter soli]